MDRSSRFLAAVHRHRLWLFALLMVSALGLAFFARNIKVDNSLRIWFLDDDPALVAWEDFKKQFGNDEIVAIAATDPVSVFSPAALRRVQAATQRIEDHAKIRRVVSIVNGRHIDGDAVEIRVEDLLPAGPIGPETGAEVERRLRANPVFDGTLVSPDSKMTLIIVEPVAMDDIDAQRPGILRDLRAIAEQELARDGGTVHYGGMGVVYEGVNEASLRDSAVFSALSYLVVFVGLYLAFRRVIWVVIGFGIVTTSVLATLGVAGLAGRDLNIVTAVLPTFLMTLGILDLVHFVESYDEHGAGQRPTRQLITRSLGAVLAACLFNSLTDIAGFVSLVSAPMSAIRDFGWLASVGLAMLFVTTLIMVVVGLARFGGGRPRKQGTGAGALVQVTERLFEMTRRHRRKVLMGAAALFAVSIAGIARLDIDTYTIGFLDDESRVRRDHDRIESQFGPFVPYEMVVKAPAADGIKQPDLLRRIDRMERAFEADERVGRVTGLPEIVRRLNQVVLDGDPAELRIPDTQAAVAQELLLYESDEDSEIETIADSHYTITRVTARSGLPTAREIGRTIADLTARGQKALGGSATVEASGYIPLYVKIIDHIARTQIAGFGYALLIVTVVLAILLRSIRLGLIALIPNVVPVAMTLAFMGFVGIRLDVATVLIASIITGLSVNDTSHVFFRFKEELAHAPEDGAAEAVRRTVMGAGKAMMTSSLILAGGFFVLALSSVKSIANFGLLCAMATLFAMLAELIITPAILLTFSNYGRRPRRFHVLPLTTP